MSLDKKTSYLPWNISAKDRYIGIVSNDEFLLIWEKDQNALHSCFVLSNEIVFNKQGQTMFNPYQCVPLDDILINWKWDQTSGGQLSIFRKK